MITHKYISIIIFVISFIYPNQLKNIEIKGNRVTKDYIILREIEQPIPGNYNPEIANEDRNRIYNLNLFSRVDIDTLENMYIIDVSEKFYCFPLPIFSYNEDVGASYGAVLLNMNFRGRDETIASGLIKGKANEYFLYYFNPWLYGNHISFGFEFEKLSYSHHAYKIIDNINNLNFFSGFHLSKKNKFKYILGYSSHQMSHKMDLLYKYINARVKYYYDSRDIYIDPTKGTLLNINLDNRIGLSDTKSILQFEFDWNSYISITKQYTNPVLAYRFNLYLQASYDEIPLFFKEYIGGYELVKGYSSIPNDNNINYSNLIESDNYLFQSIKIQNTIFPRQILFSFFGKEMEVGCDFKLFFDYGIGSLYDDNFRLSNSIFGYGAGTTIYIDGNEVNIDLGFNQDREYRIHLYGAIDND